MKHKKEQRNASERANEADAVTRRSFLRKGALAISGITVASAASEANGRRSRRRFLICCVCRKA